MFNILLLLYFWSAINEISVNDFIVTFGDVRIIILICFSCDICFSWNNIFLIYYVIKLINFFYTASIICFDATRLKTIIPRNNSKALKTTGTAFIHSFPTDLPEFWKPYSILHVFSPPFPSCGVEELMGMSAELPTVFLVFFSSFYP